MMMMLSDATQEEIHITGTSTCIDYDIVHGRANERVIYTIETCSEIICGVDQTSLEIAWGQVHPQ